MTPPIGEADRQWQLVLTPHPLQRVGAYALAALAGERDPELLGPGGFERAVEELVGNAVQASVRESKAVDGFWQKMSLSFFPNSPMNHPGRRKGKTDDGRPKSDADVREAVRAWLTEPEAALGEGVGCALCGREACGFYGKRDVVLAESEAYRNTTPRGHEGLALCWPCLASFYALPYGCQLTGGSSVALHSWNEPFLAQVVTRQVGRNRRLAVSGDESKRQTESRELVAMRALRAYSERFTAGVDLLIFNNNNRGQLLESHSVSQPLAEWLRRTSRLQDLRRAFTVLVRAHRTTNVSGAVGLARNAFRAPTRILSTGTRGLTSLMEAPDPDVVAAAEVAGLLVTFAHEVMQVNEKDLAEIRATGHKLAGLWAEEKSIAPLKELRRLLRTPGKLRGWLTKQSVAWAADPGLFAEGPLISVRAHVLLFDVEQENRGWLHRDLLLISVLEELARRGWTPDDDAEPDEVLAELDEADRKFINNEDEEEGQ
ncbi:hypothetical protein ACGH2B_25120 [Streptomyces sp. BBFR2]|uniref:hypothetical protein n=1 Tax=Streptomyces sp. BBFR2 TaxID=3372854 RepID=UPI0037D9F2FD